MQPDELSQGVRVVLEQIGMTSVLVLVRENRCRISEGPLSASTVYVTSIRFGSVLVCHLYYLSTDMSGNLYDNRSDYKPVSLFVPPDGVTSRWKNDGGMRSVCVV